MKLTGLKRRICTGLGFTALDLQIERIREIRDSYREANIAIYGVKLAELLNDWR